ncbi:MAG: D-alanine--D-alanine ligase [Bacteroidales bacterium]|nr:D-alanine--D-alanine ligase [Candidatus Colimorpha onthohippi]
MKNVALVMGGYSDECVVSMASGEQVYASLDKSKYNVYKIVVDRTGWYWLRLDGTHGAVDKNDFTVTDDGQRVRFDVVFNIIHGTPGENGMLQGYWDMLGVPYTTCGFYTSALTFNKGYCNPVVRSFGVVSVAQSKMIQAGEKVDVDALVNALGLPLFVKPASGGSSVATSKVKSREELMPAIQWALEKDSAVLVEQFIKGREFDCGVIRSRGELRIFPITEIIPTGGHEFFDYEAKYQGFSNEVTPADVEEAVSSHIQEVSAQLYDMLNCRGMVRFDYIFDTERNELFFLEVNTIPGQSAESIVPKQARAVGISTAQLYDMIIDCAACN